MKTAMEFDADKPQKDVKITASVLDAFDLLKAAKDDVKLTGGVKIISQLQSNESAKDIQYVLKRLVRSLGANIPDKRTGYFTTLVALLSKFDQITVPHLVDLVKKELHANGSSKSEVGDVALGHILLCSAIFRSGLMLRSSDEEQKEVIHLLLAASRKKSYLSSVAYLMLLDFVNTLNKDQFSSIVWSNIKQDFKKDLKEFSLDTLYFLFVVSVKFPEKIKLRKLLGVPEILCEDNIHVICEKLMAGIDYKSVNHPIYKEIGTHIANSPHLQLFWTSGIDSLLVKHNRNRELVAVNLLTIILKNLHDNVEVIPNLISENFFKLFIDWFKGLQTASKIRNKRDDEEDHKIMIKKEKELLNALATALKSQKVEGITRIETLKKLLFYPGEMNFTEFTGTSIVKSIIADLDIDGVKTMAKLLKGVLLNTSVKVIKEDVKRKWYNNERLKAAELISYLVSHEAVKDDIKFKLTYMKLLMCFAFFKISGDNNIAVSNELAGAIKSCFYRCFSSRFSNADSLVEVLSSLSNFINSLMEKEQIRAKLEKQFSNDNMECWNMLLEVCQNIEKNGSKLKVDKVFLILLYQLGLFLFSEPTHIKMARSSIKELKSCYEHYRGEKQKKAKKIKEGDLIEDVPEWIEVLVEVLLSILSTESSVLRSVVQCVFRLLCEYLTPSSIGQIVSILDPDSDSNPLTQDSESEDGDDTDDDTDSEVKENGDATSEENNESDSDIEDNEDNDMKTPDQLRLAVQKALGAAAPETDTESIDADMIDKEEGRKLDEALAEAFRQYHQGKRTKSKKDRKDKKTLSDFRIRVLGLLDIYLEKDPSMDICLGMIAPLTRCLEFCIHDNQFVELENRVRKTIKTLTKIRKFSSIDDVTTENLCDYLKSTIDKGTRSHFMFQALGDVITNFATFIIHCSQKVPESPKKGKHISPLVEIFKTSLHSYFQNRNCLLPIIFFHNILQTEWVGNFDLVPVIIENVFNNNVRQFRRTEGLELIAGFYRTLKRTKMTSQTVIKQLADIEANFENTLMKTLNGDTEFEAKNNFFLILKKLINTMKMFHESSNVETSMDFKLLLEKVASVKTNKNQKQEPPNQQNNTKSIRKNKKKKRKLEQANGHSEPQQKIVRKD